MTIQTATIADLDGLVPLFDAYRVFYEKPSDAAGARAFLQARFEHGDSVIFLAYEGGRQVGFTQLYPLFSSVRMRRLWLLNDLFVLPAMRGKGVSMELIARAQQFCKETDACALALSTAKNNTVGNQLYPKMGFALDTEFNHYEWTA